MKKWMSIWFVSALCLLLPLVSVAAELTGCTVSVDKVTGQPGETITVAVRMEDNPGFTNFSVTLDYDREQLTLTGVQTQQDGQPYLCGSHVGVNGESGCLVSASPVAVKADGILFTATFEVAPDFYGIAQITPSVAYVRNNEAVFSVFQELHTTVIPGEISLIQQGDVNGDGLLEYDDVMLAYKAFLGEVELTEQQMAVVDRNGNGILEETEYQAIYHVYVGG